MLVILDQVLLYLETSFTEKIIYSCDAYLNKLALLFPLN